MLSTKLSVEEEAANVKFHRVEYLRSVIYPAYKVRHRGSRLPYGGVPAYELIDDELIAPVLGPASFGLFHTDRALFTVADG